MAMRPSPARVQSQPVRVDLAGISLQGDLTIPGGASGIVVFAHGSGSSRLSARNRFVAASLVEAGMGTLLVDLLTPDEEHDRTNVFDIGLLAGRLGAFARWLLKRPEAAGLQLGYFGASTGGGAALVAAAEGDPPVAAVVSRGGRPDLAGEWLPQVTAPTLLIVGGRDATVLDLNRLAYQRLLCTKRLEVIPGATHLFEEPGTLEAVAILAANWLAKYLNQPEGVSHASPRSGVRNDDRGY
jgi:putative phosphoribosyl transferase